VYILDEAITLAAALHYAGWRHVIATLWSVSDIAAAEVAEDVYSQLVDEEGAPPSARRRSAPPRHQAAAQY
jgi:CHAT domain-containing protein